MEGGGVGVGKEIQNGNYGRKAKRKENADAAQKQAGVLIIYRGEGAWGLGGRTTESSARGCNVRDLNVARLMRCDVLTLGRRLSHRA